jgi:hypothetical protein
MTAQLERTGRRIVAGTWGCAAITMAASAANAALTYGALGDNRALGLATGVAVDIGLCVALIGDRQLYTHGLSSDWGRALRVTTAVMSLILNVGISIRDGHYFAALLHSFLPVLLIVLCEYGQDCLLQLTALRREQETVRQAPVAPTPDSAPLPQLHRPLAPPPVAATRAPTPYPATRHLQEAPHGHPSRPALGHPYRRRRPVPPSRGHHRAAPANRILRAPHHRPRQSPRTATTPRPATRAALTSARRALLLRRWLHPGSPSHPCRRRDQRPPPYKPTTTWWPGSGNSSTTPTGGCRDAARWLNNSASANTRRGSRSTSWWGPQQDRLSTVPQGRSTEAAVGVADERGGHHSRAIPGARGQWTARRSADRGSGKRR